MAENGPVVEFRETVHGHGDIVFPDHRVSDVSFSLERPKYAYTEPWRVTAHAREWSEGLRHFQPGSIEGHTDYGVPLSVPYFRPGEQTIPMADKARVRMHGWADEVRVGDDSVEVTPQSHAFTVYLTETSIALQEYANLADHWSGQALGEHPREPLVWDCSLGRAEIERWFVRETARVGDSDASVRIPRPSIFVCGPPAHTEPKPLRAFLESLTGELRDLCSVLSFLGRRRVDWAQIEVWPRRDDGRHSGHYEIKWLKEAIASPAPVGVDSLIRPQVADRALIANMVSAYRSSAIQRSLFYAIASLDAVLQPSFVEQRVAAAFSALEAVVNGLAESEGNEFTLADASLFSDLCRDIRRTVKESGKRLQPPLTSEQRADIYAKLSELNRPPITDRVVRFVNQYHVAWRDLWPNAESLTSAIRPAYNRRSRLIHVGRLDDVEASIRDYMNVHALTERLVYAVLGGDKSALGPLAYSHLGL